MKKIIIKISVISCLFMGTMSCEDFLELDNPNDITADVFFETPEQVQLAVNTLYASFTAVMGDTENGVFVLNVRGDDAKLVEGAFESQVVFDFYNNTPQTGITDGLFSGFYTVIFRANTVLANMDKADWSGNEALRASLAAEAHFFRGIGYFYLAYMFGQVPVVTDIEGFDNAKASSIGEVYDQAIADLQLAKAGLPAVQQDAGRATKGAATGFLGKTYLYRAGYLGEDNYYALAATEFKEVIDMGIYRLVDKYEDNFTAANENNEESLFELQYLFNPSLGTPTQGRPFNSVPGIAGEIYLTPSEWLMETMGQERTVNDEYDPRYLQTIYFFGGLPLFSVPFEFLGDGLSCQNGQGVGSGDGSNTEGGWWRKYLNVNLSCPPGLSGRDPDNNERIMRYADILLMYAEAVVMSGGNMAEAVAAVKQVRDRANLPVKTYANNNELMEEIRHQRVVEFAYESMRYFDLLRWGMLKEALMEHGFETQAANYDPVQDKYFPIPVEEVNNNPNVEQNDPWK